LTFEDVFKLLSGVKTDFDALLKVISFYKIKGNNNQVLQNRMVLSAVKTKEGIIIPGLRKLKNSNCIFYKKPNCKIYSKRPLACRTYPFAFHQSKPIITWTWAKDAEKTCLGLGKGKNWSETKLKKLGEEALELIRRHNELIKELNLEASDRTPLTAKEILWIFIAYAQKQ
jgi:Fe-S-cluster containining protein